MATIGYIRVSSADQNEDRQMLAMSEQGIPPECVFTDKQSGKDFDRIAYQSMLWEHGKLTVSALWNRQV